LTRLLVRIANADHYKPKDTRELARRIRELLGSREAIGHLRVSGQAVEFNLFANGDDELAERRSMLESRIGKIATLKVLDLPTKPRPKLDVFREGVQLFNQERFWECHEVLEQIWHPAKGPERDIIQGLILIAAALVHFQKDENETCLRMLKKALTKIGDSDEYEGLDLGTVREQVNRMIDSKNPEAFAITLNAAN
jgi:uncharacterized protein